MTTRTVPIEDQTLELGDALSPKAAAFLLSIGMIDKATAARAFGFPPDFVPKDDES